MKDAQIRTALQSTLLKKFYHNESCKVVEELNVCMGEARIDIAVLNGKMMGFEIKSEADTLQRLQSQVKTYLKVFDYITVVAAPKHCEQVLSLVPPCCGVVSVHKQAATVRIRWVKRPRKNSQKDAMSLCQLLWKEELHLLLKEFGLTKGLSGKPKIQLWNLLATVAPQQKLSKRVTEILKNRTAWREDQPST